MRLQSSADVLRDIHGRGWKRKHCITPVHLLEANAMRLFTPLVRDDAHLDCAFVVALKVFVAFVKKGYISS